MPVKRSKSEGFMLRLPDGLREKIKEEAAANQRSMNAEIVARLEGVIPSDDEGWLRIWLPADLRERIEAKAQTYPTPPEWLIRETLEEAFPYIQTLGDYARDLRREINAGRRANDHQFIQFVEALETAIRMDPSRAEDPLVSKHRGYEMPPEPEE